MTRSQGDLTGEGDVGGADYNEVLTYWGMGSPPSETASIPEPAALWTLLIGIVSASLRKEQKRSG